MGVGERGEEAPGYRLKVKKTKDKRHKTKVKM